jgi:hypothetical protein
VLSNTFKLSAFPIFCLWLFERDLMKVIPVVFERTWWRLFQLREENFSFDNNYYTAYRNCFIIFNLTSLDRWAIIITLCLLFNLLSTSYIIFFALLSSSLKLCNYSEIKHDCNIPCMTLYNAYNLNVNRNPVNDCCLMSKEQFYRVSEWTVFSVI